MASCQKLKFMTITESNSEGDVIFTSRTDRHWVLLNVTQDDLEKGLFADRVGLHAFGGMWYGDDPMAIKSYGKLLAIGDGVKVVGTVHDYDLDTLKEMVG